MRRKYPIKSVSAIICSLTIILWSVFSQTPGSLSPGDPLPQVSAMSAELPGSVLLYSYFTAASSQLRKSDTVFSLVNTHPQNRTNVHLFFVNAQGGGTVDKYVCLSANQKLTFNGCPGALSRNAAGLHSRFSHRQPQF